MPLMLFATPRLGVAPEGRISRREYTSRGDAAASPGTEGSPREPSTVAPATVRRTLRYASGYATT